MILKKENIPDSMFIKSELERGTKIEFEHTNNKKKAKAIAKQWIIKTGKKTNTGKWTSKYYDGLHKLEVKLMKALKK